MDKCNILEVLRNDEPHSWFLSNLLDKNCDFLVVDSAGVTLCLYGRAIMLFEKKLQKTQGQVLHSESEFCSVSVNRFCLVNMTFKILYYVKYVHTFFCRSQQLIFIEFVKLNI